MMDALNVATLEVSGYDSLYQGENLNFVSPEYEAKIHQSAMTFGGMETFHKKLYQISFKILTVVNIKMADDYL